MSDTQNYVAQFCGISYKPVLLSITRRASQKKWHLWSGAAFLALLGGHCGRHPGREAKNPDLRRNGDSWMPGHTLSLPGCVTSGKSTSSLSLGFLSEKSGWLYLLRQVAVRFQ